MVGSPDDLRPAIVRLLADVVFAPDLDDRAHDRVVRTRSCAPSPPTATCSARTRRPAARPRQQSFIEVQAAVEEARQNRVDAEADGGRAARASSTRSGPSRPRRSRRSRETAAARKEAEGHRNAAARRLAELGAAARSAKAEADRLAQSRFQAEQARDRDLAGLAELEDRLRAAEETPIDADPSTEERDELAAAVPAARQREMEVRLAVRTAEERVGALSGRADALARQAAAEREARDRAAARRAARARGAAIARAVVAGAESRVCPGAAAR